LMRDFGGAIVFAFPLLMTMEMWWLGFYMDRLRLALFIFLGVLLLLGIAYYLGVGSRVRWKYDLIDVFTAYAVGFTTSTIMLLLLAVIQTEMQPNEIIGKIVLQAAPAGIGAMLAERQFGHEEEGQRAERRRRYAGKLVFMLAGAFFLALTVAPTEEMAVIGSRMEPWHAVALAIVSLLIVHAFVYAVEAREGVVPSHWGVFLRFTVVGYAIALLVSLYILWSFGRMDGASAAQIVASTMVLGFPAALGAGAARLIL